MGSQYDGRHTTPGHVGSCCMHLRPGFCYLICFTFFFLCSWFIVLRQVLLHVHGGLNSKSWKGVLFRIAKCEYSWPEVTDEQLTLANPGGKEDRGETPRPEPAAAMEARSFVAR